jgi:hypothetical protein
MSLESLALYSGFIASIWIIIGTYVAGRYYPRVNHAKQLRRRRNKYSLIFELRATITLKNTAWVAGDCPMAFN